MILWGIVGRVHQVTIDSSGKLGQQQSSELCRVDLTGKKLKTVIYFCFTKDIEHVILMKFDSSLFICVCIHVCLETIFFRDEFEAIFCIVC